MESTLVINFTHLLLAVAVFAGVFLAVRYGRMEKLKREVKAAEMAKQLAEDKLYNAQMEHDSYRMRAVKAVKVAQMEQELAQLKAANVDNRVAEERHTSDKIISKIESAFGRNDKAFQTILDQQVNNASKLAETLVSAVKATAENKPNSIINQHFGSDEEE
jgi:hypothetical protein